MSFPAPGTLAVAAILIRSAAPPGCKGLLSFLTVYKYSRRMCVWSYRKRSGATLSAEASVGLHALCCSPLIHDRALFAAVIREESSNRQIGAWRSISRLPSLVSVRGEKFVKKKGFASEKTRPCSFENFFEKLLSSTGAFGTGRRTRLSSSGHPCPLSIGRIVVFKGFRVSRTHPSTTIKQQSPFDILTSISTCMQ